MFKTKVDTFQEGGLHIDEHCWTLDKRMASLSTYLALLIVAPCKQYIISIICYLVINKYYIKYNT